MKTSIVSFLAATLCAGAAWAQGGGAATKAAPPASAPAAAPAAPDMSKMGPWSRKPNEAAAKKEIAAFFKGMDEAEKKEDMAAMVAAIDFPVYMMTDDSKGVPKSEEWNKEKYEAVMKGMMTGMPKDVKMTHRPTVTVLSDSMANVVDDFTMTVGKQKLSARNMAVLVKRDGKWLFKVMGEAGWGDVPMPASAPPAATK
jgi:hypothetical protein